MKKLYNAMDVTSRYGNNARRMLDIGIIQDELLKLTFIPTSENLIPQYVYKHQFSLDNLCISFEKEFISIYTPRIGNIGFYYKSPTWKQDFLLEIKELIKDKK